jgi:hypothetical protein
MIPIKVFFFAYKERLSVFYNTTYSPTASVLYNYETSFNPMKFYIEDGSNNHLKTTSYYNPED